MFYSYDEANMQVAIDEAALAAKEGNMPFGACLCDENGQLIAQAHNQCQAASKRGGNTQVDVTRHAEMELIRQMATFDTTEPPHGGDKQQMTMYASTQPCVMCAGAIYWSGVGRVVYGCSASQLETISGPGGFDIDCHTLYGMASPGARQIQVAGPLLAEQALQVHRESGVWQGSTTGASNTTTAADLDIAVEASLKETGLGSAAVVDDGVVPVIDLSDGTEAQVAQRLWQAATQVGFFTVTGHDIEQSLMDQAFDVSRQFFAQSLDDKQQQSPLDMRLNSGFEYFSQVRPSTGVADQKESLQVTGRQGCMEGRWPNNEFENTAQKLMTAAHNLANRILDLLEPLALPQSSSGKILSSSHTLWGEDGQCTLRFLNYPVMDAETTQKLLGQGNYWRAGPHTDWANITLLFQRVGESGLECCANPRTGNPKEMYWTAVKPVPGGIAVNIGDMLSRWSDGKLYSNLHRVRLPQDASKPRYSIAYFAQSDKKTLIESRESEPITAGDYILSRIQSNFESSKN